MLFQIVAWLYFWPTAALTRCLSLSLSLCSPPSLLCLLYALWKGYADQCPLNLSSASVCAKIIGDSLPAASGANIRCLLLQGVSFVVSTALAGILFSTNCGLFCSIKVWFVSQSYVYQFCVYLCLLVHLVLMWSTVHPPVHYGIHLVPALLVFIAQSIPQN